MKLGARLTAGAALLGIAGIVAAVYGCGSRFAVGDIRERSQEAERERAVRSLELEAVTTFKTTDSPSPVWSPDGETLVYAERYNARLYAYSPVDESREVIFDGNQNTALPDLRYNVDAPAFLDSHHVLSGPAWASGLDQNDAWSGVLQIDIVNKTASAFGNFGARPRVSPDGSRVLLEASDGIRMTSPDGTEIDRFKNLRDGHWAPDGQSFVALSYDRYYDDVDGLVHINLEGRTEKIYGGPAYEPAWHPDGGGIAFTRPSRGDMYFHPEWMYGTVILSGCTVPSSSSTSNRATSAPSPTRHARLSSSATPICSSTIRWEASASPTSTRAAC